MANAASETVLYPFTAFNFLVEIQVEGLTSRLYNAAFSECDGLDMTMEVKTIREGGNNGAQIRLLGPMTYSQVTLKRGMTDSFDIWDWFKAVLEADATALRTRLRGNGQVTLLAADGKTPKVQFKLTGCVPVKVKAPALNAKEGTIAIEELQMAYESLSLERPAAGGGR
jgi:phage tail-like protein